MEAYNLYGFSAGEAAAPNSSPPSETKIWYPTSICSCTVLPSETRQLVTLVYSSGFNSPSMVGINSVTVG